MQNLIHTTLLRPGYTVQHCAQYCAQHPSLDVATRSQHFVQHYRILFLYLKIEKRPQATKFCPHLLDCLVVESGSEFFQCSCPHTACFKMRRILVP